MAAGGRGCPSGTCPSLRPLGKYRRSRPLVFSSPGPLPESAITEARAIPASRLLHVLGQSALLEMLARYVRTGDELVQTRSGLR